MNAIPKRLVALIWSSLTLLATPLPAAVVTANFTSATTVPVTAASYTATGNTVNFTLNFAPPAGTSLTVVKNTGLAFISGAFSNLAQGQAVNLTYGGVTYPFVANYYGGTGNDLVLQWASTRLVAWGYNGSGALGNNTTTNSAIAVGVDMSGALAGKRLVALAAGASYNLALCADGTLVAWGSNSYGQLGNNSTSNLSAPGLVTQTGVLAGRTVVAIAAGTFHNLVLCADGTLASWGYNYSGQLGNNSTTNSSVPVMVNQTGVLAGKTVVALAAGASYNLALCSDGTLAAWGDNGAGELGNATTANSSVPVLVSRTGVLAGKTVTAIAAGEGHGMALCTDGTLAAWGGNSFGQLGNSLSTNSSVPVLVNQSGVLAGKTLVASGGGAQHSLALCSDGTVSAWGYNSYGNLGNNSTSESHVPVLVDTTGVLAGKTVISIAAGDSHNLALCADRTLVAWGDNNSGQLGNASTTNSSVPVLVGSSLLGTGERFTAMRAGYSHSLALVAMPPPPVATTLAASAIGDLGATLNGNINAQGTATAASFEYGLTTAYGAKVAATPATVTATATTAVSATLSGLLSATTYHYRMVAVSGGGTVPGIDMTFTTGNSACLSSLGVSAGTLQPAFNRNVTSYSLAVGFDAATLSFTPVVLNTGATVTVNGVAAASGGPSGALALAVGNQRIDVTVTAPDGGNTDTYSVIVTRLPAVFAFNSAASVPVTVGDILATGNSVSFALNFAPVAGTELMVLKNTGTGQIQGRFDNLAQWQQVSLAYAGITYAFVANYRGGNGNDLVLQWANTRLLGWGWNGDGELGNNSMVNSPVPVSVDLSDVLAGRTVVAVCPGSSHNLALCADGTLATWGGNTYGQLGNNSSTTSVVPVAVTQTGVLAGKAVVAVCAGGSHNLALCSDGTLAAWGYNSSGQLGNKSSTNSSVPVLVDQTGVLAGRTVVALGAGSNHSLALCADGMLAAWGDNTYGQLGNNSPTSSSVPVAVSQTGVLAGKTLIAIAGGGPGSLALCADGTLAAWGTNSYGQLGNNSPASGSSVPVAVSQSGVLAGKTVVAIAGGGGQSLVLCDDGTMAVWGDNSWGALGTSAVNQSNVPILPNLSGVLAGKTFAAIGAGSAHSLVLCTDGTAAAWGYNTYGQLGNNNTNQSNVPVLVNVSALKPGERFVAMRGGSNHSMALVASPPPPVATTLAAGSVLDTSATLSGSVSAQGSSSTVTFEYGLTTWYGASVAATPGAVTGTTTTAVSAVAAGLLSGSTYHYRAVAASAGGIVKGADLTFTTSSLACLASLAASNGAFVPAFDSKLTSYSLSVPFAVTSLSLIPVVLSPGATVTIGGMAVASGSASGTLDLTVGSNPVSVVVSAVDPTNTQTYTVTVTRLPAVCAFASATTVPVTVRDFAASGKTVAFVLNFAPPVGTNLTAVKSTGYGPIQGTFDNLAQGQLVNLTYGGVTYGFVANYGGGTGNDLVLQWANTRAVIWGGNSGGPGVSNAPVPVDATGVLAGKLFLALAAGNGYSLALCADGTLAGWGTNTSSQLGNGSTTSSTVPVLVNQTGVLAGKTPMALAAGRAHSLALCADGTLTAWGANGSGQLGNGTLINNTVPALVNQAGVLAGKAITAIAAGNSHSLVLCADGTLAAWGANDSGQLGNGGTVSSSTPVLVSLTGVLAGKTVSAITARGDFCMVLCADGTIAAWGANGSLNLGNGTSINSSVPVLVNQTGVLAGKTVLAVSAGTSHGLALCADGSMAAWGNDYYGQLGDNNTNDWSTRPVSVITTGVLSGKTAVAIAAGDSHSLALCADGTLAAWGYNGNGQLGNVVNYQSALPVLVIASGLAAGERFMTVTSGLNHGLALVAAPPPPQATTLAATGINDTRATFNANVNAEGSSSSVAFEYGPTTAYGTTVAATPATLTGATVTAASVTLSSLLSGTTYHYRVVISSTGGTAKGQDMTFTTTDFARLTSIL